MSLMHRLKSDTREAHEAVEDLPFAKLLASGQAPRDRYVGWLQALARIYDELEQTAFEGPAAAVWTDAMRRSHLLQADFDALDASPRPDTLTPADAHALVACQQIRMHRADAFVVGMLYVLEGSALGGALLAKSMGKALGGVGVAYLKGHGTGRGSHWKAFGKRVDALPAGVHDRVVDGAHATFEVFAGLFRVLDTNPATKAHVVNHEAGKHYITQDPDALEAALRAGERTMAEYPYLQERYGERGVRFTRSDSAWLVALAQQSPQRVQQQIRWLGVVLSSRGMPSLILETHLRHLDAMLPGMERLVEAADILAKERESVIPTERFETLASGLSDPAAGTLVVAAVADERNGIKRAVSSLVNWLGDEERTSKTFAADVRGLVAEARAVRV